MDTKIQNEVTLVRYSIKELLDMTGKYLRSPKGDTYLIQSGYFKTDTRLIYVRRDGTTDYDYKKSLNPLHDCA